MGLVVRELILRLVRYIVASIQLMTICVQSMKIAQSPVGWIRDFVQIISNRCIAS